MTIGNYWVKIKMTGIWWSFSDGDLFLRENEIFREKWMLLVSGASG